MISDESPYTSIFLILKSRAFFEAPVIRPSTVKSGRCGTRIKKPGEVLPVVVLFVQDHFGLDKGSESAW